MRYLIFGASTGAGMKDPEFSGWAGRLKKHLETNDSSCLVYNLCISGDTSDRLLVRFKEEALRRIDLYGKPKDQWTIIIAMGTNDSRLVDNKDPQTPLDDYVKNMSTVIEQAKEIAVKYGIEEVTNLDVPPY